MSRTMANGTASLRVTGLGKQKMAALTRKARRMGLTPQNYLKHLVEQDLALDRKAQTISLSRLMGPGREIDENELDRLVDQARDRHHSRTSRKARTSQKRR